MADLRRQIEEAVADIRAYSKLVPEVGIVLGTGLGAFAQTIEAEASIPFEEIAHFPVPTVAGHAGKLILGKVAGRSVVAMDGRFHYYEGYTMQEITIGVRVMRALGAKLLVLSNACGGMNPQYERGDILLIEDHINLMGDNPLIGPNDDELGSRYPDMVEPYDKEILALAARIALEEKVRAHKGVYVAVAGPNLETRAEYRFLRGIGADVVGMSTVPENLVAVHMGMKVLGIGIVTDLCLPDALGPAKIEEIIRIASEAEPKLARIVTRLIKESRL
jgi:purine-nucleoside phosphorylase